MTGINISDLESGSKSWGGEGFEMGDAVKGEVVEAEQIQQTSFESGEPLFWSDGKPRMMSRVVIQTDLGDGGDDDGKRTLYLKGGNFEVADGEGTSGEKALIEAMKKAGAKSIEPGGTLHVKISGQGKATTRGYRPPKLWKMKYEAPVKAIQADDLDF